jgi:hypothetical protein
MAGFIPRYRLSGSAFTKQDFTIGAPVAIGDLVKLSSGKVVPATTDGGSIVGAVLGPSDYDTSMASLTNDVSKVQVVTDADAVYGVADASARVNGATLDVAGTTGAMTIAASDHAELQVVADSTAAEETLIRVVSTDHYQL